MKLSLSLPLTVMTIVVQQREAQGCERITGETFIAAEGFMSNLGHIFIFKKPGVIIIIFV